MSQIVISWNLDVICADRMEAFSTGSPGRIGFSPADGKPTPSQKASTQKERDRVFRRYCSGKPTPILLSAKDCKYGTGGQFGISLCTLCTVAGTLKLYIANLPFAAP